MQQDTPYDNGLPSHFPEKDKVPFCDPWPQSRSTVKLPSLDSPTWIAVATFLLSERKDSGNRRVNRSSVKPFAKYFGLERVCGINKALKRFQKRFQENIGPNEEIEMGCACSSRGASPGPSLTLAGFNEIHSHHCLPLPRNPNQQTEFLNFLWVHG